jgi:hypothetical protein
MDALGAALFLIALGMLSIGIGLGLPGRLRLLSMAVGIAFVFFGAFIVGFEKYPSEQEGKLAQQLAAYFFFASGVAWGVSVIGDPAWNSWFNFFAAGFATFALGYGTPLIVFGYY